DVRRRRPRPDPRDSRYASQRIESGLRDHEQRERPQDVDRRIRRLRWHDYREAQPQSDRSPGPPRLQHLPGRYARHRTIEAEGRGDWYRLPAEADDSHGYQARKRGAVSGQPDGSRSQGRWDDL